MCQDEVGARFERLVSSCPRGSLVVDRLYFILGRSGWLGAVYSTAT